LERKTGPQLTPPAAEIPPAYNILTVRSSNKRVSMEIEITHEMAFDQERRINEAIQQERPRLRNFIRRRVADEGDAEDILQDVFYELIQAYRMMKPIEQVGAWLYRVARNRIIDLFRRARPQQSLADPVLNEDGGTDITLEDLLPSPDEGPEAAFAHSVLVDELAAAIEELPPDQRLVFVAHEIEGKSFKELAGETGVSVNTLLSRKRYAVMHLRKRLQSIHDEFIRE
jgi:RNA polymerase sigma factor (sigma-70 family)